MPIHSLRDNLVPKNMHRLWKTYILAVVLLVLAGCSASSPKPNSQDLDPLPVPENPRVGLEESAAQRLAQLQKERSDEAFAPRFAIGPGDVIKVSEPDLKEFNQTEVRVSAENTVVLPLIGTINVSGMTEDQLRATLQAHLSTYVKDPQVDVFVQQYHNRQVAVLGMVRKPGLYTIAGRADTIQDMIGRAGGMTADASSRILFIPATSSSNPDDLTKTAREISQATASDDSGVQPKAAVSSPTADALEASEAPEDAEGPGQEGQKGFALSSISLRSRIKEDPISIDVAGTAGAGELDLPVRPGDLLIVPAAGEVIVDGWVKNPGAYKISSGMTALAAVSAAGGAMFSSTAEVLRTNPNSVKTAFSLDLSKVKSGEQPDVLLQASDIVLVQKSVLGAVPYSFYELFQKFGTGLMVPAF
jgi:polysaccharide biosynthesis/export protein